MVYMDKINIVRRANGFDETSTSLLRQGKNILCNKNFTSSNYNS
jgi:hypothetical protein